MSTDSPRPLDGLTLEDFQPWLGHEFGLVMEQGPPLPLLLVEAKDMDVRSRPERFRRPFSLLLRGPREPVFPQRIYRLVHAEMGTLDLFLVPVGPDDEGLLYEAVFQ